MSIASMISYGQSKIGKVSYSMTNRNREDSMDCSSFVFKALVAGGFLTKNTAIGNTESLFALKGKLFSEITFQQVQKGDLFIAGHQGASSGSAGHTGIHLGKGKILHCTYSYGNRNIALTNALGWMGDASGLPVRHFRLLKKQTTIKKADKQLTTLAVDGQWGKATTLRLQEIYGLAIRDSILSHQYRQLCNQYLYAAQFDYTQKGSQLISCMQQQLGLTTDGLCGSQTIQALQKKMKTTVDGTISPQSQMVRVLQQKLNQNKKPF